MKSRNILYCYVCEKEREFRLEGNIKICEKCQTKTSYKYEPVKRWTYAKSHPDIVGISPYNQESDDNVQDKFDAIYNRFCLLSKREREVIELLWEGKTEQEVAILLQVSSGNISTLLKRARKKLKGL